MSSVRPRKRRIPRASRVDYARLNAGDDALAEAGKPLLTQSFVGSLSRVDTPGCPADEASLVNGLAVRDSLLDVVNSSVGQVTPSTRDIKAVQLATLRSPILAEGSVDVAAPAVDSVVNTVTFDWRDCFPQEHQVSRQKLILLSMLGATMEWCPSFAPHAGA